MLNKLATIVGIALLVGSCSIKPKTPDEIMAKAKKIHKEFATIDTHCDTPLNFLRPDFDFCGDKNKPHNGRVDLHKMEVGGLDASFFAVFTSQRECTPDGFARAHQKALKILYAIIDSVSKVPNRAQIATNPEDVYTLKKQGKRAIYIGVENGYPIGYNLDYLKDLYNLGARYLTLCHTRNNQICDSANDPDGNNKIGLSEFGKQVVVEMNKLGMMIDVSHISDKAFYDVISLSKTPVIASHSCARAICDNPRNLNDSMLIALKKNGGVIQLCILSEYVKKNPNNPTRDSAYVALDEKYRDIERTPSIEEQITRDWIEIEDKYPPILATVADAVDHIDHIVKIIGIDHVGIGTDFDGGGGLKDCKDASEMHNITAELIKRGYSNKDIKKIWGENILRVFRDVQVFAY